ncbi:DUF2442 domain-containing protein [Pontiellaceae bacterium B12227]|nr:DUF2442 domain-containing protein [Pontiellaceae bacterium B12227]
MKLKKHGESTSIIEVTNLDRMGFWILVGSKEYYLSFSDFPWFMDASIKNITHVVKESENHLYWPDLDIDLTLEMIENPEAYPLKYK